MEIQINNIQLVSYRWFTSRTTVGIVLCRDTVLHEDTAYIGAGEGEDELTDLSNIMMWGTKFPVDVAKQLIYK